MAATHYEGTPGLMKTLQAALDERWYSKRSLVETLDAIPRNFNLDTVEGRNAAKTHLNAATNVRGYALINLADPGERIPNAWHDTWITTVDKVFEREFINLERQLTYRETTVAKDSQVGRQQGAPATGVTTEQTTQSNQDAKKAITETIIFLLQHISHRDNIWDRSKIETDLGLRWTA